MTVRLASARLITARPVDTWAVSAAAGTAVKKSPMIDVQLFRKEPSLFSVTERTLLDLPAFASLATLLPDGTPQLTVMWYRRVGDDLHMITPAGTRKARNLAKDGRAAVVVNDPENGYRYVEMRGRIELQRDPEAIRDALFRIASRYIGAERADAYTAARDPRERVLMIFHADRVHGHFADKP
jgi:PPOX class probable F420-dependent enzyme